MDSEKELSIQMLSKAADDIATCSDDLLIVAEAIAESCNMIGDTGDGCREELSSRAEDFKMLAGLYKTRSGRFEDIVKMLEGNLQEEVVLLENAVKKN